MYVTTPATSVHSAVPDDQGFHLRTDQADSWRLHALKQLVESGVPVTATVCGFEGAPLVMPGDVIRLEQARVSVGDLIYFWDGEVLRIGRCQDRLWSSRKTTLSIQAGLLDSKFVPVPLEHILGLIVEIWRNGERISVEAPEAGVSWSRVPRAS